MTGYIGMNA